MKFIADDDAGQVGTHLAEYTRLGLNTIVRVDYTEPQIRYDLAHGAGSDPYDGLDRFGRVKDLLRRDYGAAAVRDRFTYGHDRAGNRLYREHVLPSLKDEYYTYDRVYRLVNFDRGDLNAGKTGISGTPAREQDFSLDAAGNWSGFVVKTSGSTDLDQSRTHNKVNELADISETQGASWLAPEHDRAGNMTTVPKPSDLASGLSCTYDAWNRLVRVADRGQDGSSSSSSVGADTVVARYEYLCPCQLGLAEFVRVRRSVRLSVWSGSRGMGRWSFSHRSMAA